jgi:hypothetical protein
MLIANMLYGVMRLLRFTSRAFRLILAPVALLLLTVLLAGCRVRSVDEHDYVAQNEAVFRTVPLYPGAREMTSYSIGIPDPNGITPHENGPPYQGFSTTHVYKLPISGTQKAVLAFYHQRLKPPWRWYGPGQSPGYPPPSEAGFKRGAALLYLRVGQGNVSSTALVLSVSIDYGSNRK